MEQQKKKGDTSLVVKKGNAVVGQKRRREEMAASAPNSKQSNQGKNQQSELKFNKMRQKGKEKQSAEALEPAVDDGEKKNKRRKKVPIYFAILFAVILIKHSEKYSKRKEGDTTQRSEETSKVP